MGSRRMTDKFTFTIEQLLYWLGVGEKFHNTENHNFDMLIHVIHAVEWAKMDDNMIFKVVCGTCDMEIDTGRLYYD